MNDYVLAFYRGLGKAAILHTPEGTEVEIPPSQAIVLKAATSEDNIRGWVSIETIWDEFRACLAKIEIRSIQKLVCRLIKLIGNILEYNPKKGIKLKTPLKICGDAP